MEIYSFNVKNTCVFYRKWYYTHTLIFNKKTMIKIKVNTEGRKALEEIFSLANSQVARDLNASGQVLWLLQLIDVDDEFFSKKEETEKEVSKNKN